MMNIMHFYEAGKARSGVALIPFFDTKTVAMGISTYRGNFKVKNLNGTVNITTPVKLFNTVNSGSFVNVFIDNGAIYDGNVEVTLLQGLNDVFSFWMTNHQYTNNQHKLNIQNWGEFTRQFPKLNNYRLFFYAYNTPARYCKIGGDLADMPDSVESVFIEQMNIEPNLLELNLNNFSTTSNLKYFNYPPQTFTRVVTLKGDLSKLPPLVTFFSFNGIGSFTYTAGKVWASSFDTLSIPLVLTTAELDNLLIDMDNSITTKIGAGVIALGGYRSPASDVAVASLQAKGFTVNVARHHIFQRILDLPFQNSFADSGEMGMTMVAGGTSNQPTFALSGRKAGEYCAVFNGSQSIKTTSNLPVNSDKVTVAFWMKTTQTGVAIVGEMSQNTNANNTFSWYINDSVSNSVQFNSRNTGENKSARTGANNGSWKHFAAVIDRSQNGANEILIYENGVLVSSTKNASTDNNGNFVNNILYIGQRAGNTLGFNGSLTKLKLYNYPLTAGEVSTLYNSEL